MQATGQASTQSATPSQVFVTMVCGTVFSLNKLYLVRKGVLSAEC